MVEIHSTVGKRAKKMPDATVETTYGKLIFFFSTRKLCLFLGIILKEQS